MKNIFSPVDEFKHRYEGEFTANATAAFEELVGQSKVDAESNEKTVQTIHKLEHSLSEFGKIRKHWNLLRWSIIVLGGAGVINTILSIYSLSTGSTCVSHPLLLGIPIFIFWVGIFFLLFWKINPIIKKYDQKISQFGSERKTHLFIAEEQMAPLNRLFDWDIVQKIIEKTLPNLRFDPFFNQARYNTFVKKYGLDQESYSNSSIVACQSGSYNGNPFVIAEIVSAQMGTKTYTGELTISWREQETTKDHAGHSHTKWVTRYQVLYASLDKPCPYYPHKFLLIYGNDTTPELCFSRVPSELSKLGNNILNWYRVFTETKKLEEEMKVNKDFVFMPNKKFDVFFHALDRNNETEFRLLFPAESQQEMLNILWDKKVGYGDDFSFKKDKNLIFIAPAHVNDIDILIDPKKFQNYDLATIRKNFLDVSLEYFRSVYFAFAPIFSSSTLQKFTTDEDLYVSADYQAASPWEMESIANSFGTDKFTHPEAITENILKASDVTKSDNETNVTITACAYTGKEQIEVVSKFGGDGKWHDVPVHWTEYIPIQKTSTMALKETPDLSKADAENTMTSKEKWEELFKTKDIPSKVRFQRKIISYIR